MEKLTENQKTFLLKYFFKNEEFTGWINVATKLLDKGSCIVADASYTGCIWKGGIGNFIETEPAETAHECLLYIFDLEEFLTSEYYKDIITEYLNELGEEKAAIDVKYNDIVKLQR